MADRQLNYMSILNLELVKRAYAAGGSFSVNIGDETKSRVAINEDLGSFVSKTFSGIMLFAAMAAFLYMVYGGVTWIMSGGDKGKLEDAKAKITQAVIGLAVVASAWAVFKLIDYFFGIGITK